MYKKNFDRNFGPSYKKNLPKKNQFINASQIQLINSEGENLGIKKKEEAIKIAEEEGLDLIEINPNAKPPICKIMDYSKYLYDKKKKQKNSKGKAKEQKELRFSPVIEQHDVDVRVKKTRKFLAKGHNVKLTIFRKGRQTLEQAKEVMDNLLEIFQEYNTIENSPRQEGRKLYITLKAEKKKEETQKEEKSENKKTEVQVITEPKKEKIMEKIKSKRKTEENSQNT